VVLGQGWERLGTDAVAVRHKGCIVQLIAMAGTVAVAVSDRRRIVGIGRCCWVAGRAEGRSGSLDLDLGLVAMDWASWIAGRKGCWKWIES